MATSKRVELADRLISKTEKGELEWQETANPDAFQVAFPNYSLLIGAVQTEEGSQYDIVITLFNSAGNKIDEFSDVDLYNETHLPRLLPLVPVTQWVDIVALSSAPLRLPVLIIPF